MMMTIYHRRDVGGTSLVHSGLSLQADPATCCTAGRQGPACLERELACHIPCAAIELCSIVEIFPELNGKLQVTTSTR